MTFTPMAAPTKIAPLTSGPASATRKCSLERGTYDGPDQAAQRPDVDLFLVAIEPVCRQGVGQLVQSQRQQQEPEPARCRGQLLELALGGERHGRCHKPEHDEDDQCDVHPDRSSEPPAETDRRPGQKIGHGLHPRSSAISPRDVASLSPESNLTARASARNATRPGPGVRGRQPHSSGSLRPWSDPGRPAKLTMRPLTIDSSPGRRAPP